MTEHQVTEDFPSAQKQWLYERGEGRTKHRRAPGMAEETRLGRDTGIELRFVPECATTSGQGLADALFSLAVDGQTVWGSPNHDGAETHRVSLAWPLVDLLHGLGRIWPWLILEEGYPIAITPLHPGDMMVRAETRWNDLSPAEAEAEEALLFDFRHRHDLSLLLRGLTVPPLWILREGADALVWSTQWVRPMRLSHRAVMDDLTAIGEGIARHLSESTHPRALRALRRWSERKSPQPGCRVTLR